MTYGLSVYAEEPYGSLARQNDAIQVSVTFSAAGNLSADGEVAGISATVNLAGFLRGVTPDPVGSSSYVDGLGVSGLALNIATDDYVPIAGHYYSASRWYRTITVETLVNTTLTDVVLVGYDEDNAFSLEIVGGDLLLAYPYGSLSSGTAVNDGSNHHVAAVYDGWHNEIRFYVDGSLVNTRADQPSAIQYVGGAEYSLSFDGNDDQVTIPRVAGVNDFDNESFTAEIWVYHDSSDTGKSGAYISNADYQSGGFMIGVDGGDTYYVITNSTGAQHGISSSTTVKYDQWVHLALVLDNTSGDLRFYIDGVLDDSRSGASISHNNIDLSLGKGTQGGRGDYLQAVITEVRLWNVARTQTQIQEYLNKRLGNSLSGLTAYYPIGHPTTERVVDLEGANDGSYTNDPTWIKPSQTDFPFTTYALAFDGTDDYTYAVLGNLPNAYTIEHWVKPNPDESISGFSDGIPTDSVHEKEFYTNPDGTVTFRAYDVDDFDVKPVTSTTDICDGYWHHIAVTAADGGQVRLYVDGVLEDSIAIGKTYSNYDTGYFTQGIESELRNYSSGRIYETRVWNIERSQVQIRNSMTSPLSGNEADLVAYYLIDEGSGTTLIDNANGNNATIDGARWVGPEGVSRFGFIGVPSQAAQYDGTQGTAPASGRPTVDEIRVWNRAKTDGEVANLAFTKVEPTDPDLDVYYTFDDRNAQNIAVQPIGRRNQHASTTFQFQHPITALGLEARIRTANVTIKGSVIDAEGTSMVARLISSERSKIVYVVRIEPFKV